MSWSLHLQKMQKAIKQSGTLLSRSRHFGMTLKSIKYLELAISQVCFWGLASNISFDLTQTLRNDVFLLLIVKKPMLRH